MGVVMGEYAEMMLDGTCCSCCGEYLGRDDGYPIMCDSCARENGGRDTGIDFDLSPIKPPKTLPCQSCNRKFRNQFALDQHAKAKGHRAPTPTDPAQ